MIAHTEPKPAAASSESLGMLLGLVRSELVRTLEAELAASGVDLTFTQYLIVKRLALRGPMATGELARSVDLDGGAMTRQLDQLERKGYLRRCPQPQDRRSVRIELTTAGTDLRTDTTGCSRRVLEAAQRSLKRTERAQLLDYLHRVLDALRDKS